MVFSAYPPRFKWHCGQSITDRQHRHRRLGGPLYGDYKSVRILKLKIARRGQRLGSVYLSIQHCPPFPFISQPFTISFFFYWRQFLWFTDNWNIDPLCWSINLPLTTFMIMSVCHNISTRR